MNQTSPFPGMDPFIEGRGMWEDFHDDLISCIKRELAARLPPRYVARGGARNYIDSVEPIEGAWKRRKIIPDVSIQERQAALSATTNSGTATADPATETESVVMHGSHLEEIHERYIDILDLQTDSRLVTSIEVLSPTNKRSGTKGWDEYEQKRSLFLLGQANLVEIDLLRGGQRHIMREPWPDSPYYLMVLRRELAPACRVWPAFSLRPLPPIPVPLLSPDADLTLALQPLVAEIYASSRYYVDAKYDQPVTLTLTDAEQGLLSTIR